MFGKLTLVALVGALSVSANNVAHLLTRSEHSILSSRQFSAASIPSACQSQCTSALTIYQACSSGDAAGCIAVCGANNYSGFVGCLQCVLNNTPGVTTAEVSSLNSIVAQLAGACQQAGSPVSATSFAVSATGSRSGSASASSGSASGVRASVTSISSAVASVTGSSSRSGSSSSGLLASVTSGINSATAAAASSSRAAGQAVAVLPQGIQAMALGLVGVVAGAAMVL